MLKKILEDAQRDFGVSDEVMKKFLELVSETGKHGYCEFNEKEENLIFAIEEMLSDPEVEVIDLKAQKEYLESIKDLEAEQVYLDLLFKFSYAAVPLLAQASIRRLMPVVAEKIRERKGKSQL